MDFYIYIRRKIWWFVAATICGIVVGGMLFTFLPKRYVIDGHLSVVVSSKESGHSLRDLGEESGSLVTYMIGLQHAERFLPQEDYPILSSLSLSRLERSLLSFRAVLSSSDAALGYDSVLSVLDKHIQEYAEASNMVVQLLPQGYRSFTSSMSAITAFGISILAFWALMLFILILCESIRGIVISSSQLESLFKKAPLYVGGLDEAAIVNAILPQFMDERTYVLVGDETHGAIAYALAMELAKRYRVTVIDGMLNTRNLHAHFKLSNLHALKGYTQLQESDRESLPYVLHNTQESQLYFAPAGSGEVVRSIALFQDVPGIKIIVATPEDSIFFTEGKVLTIIQLFTTPLLSARTLSQAALGDTEYIVVS